MNAVAKRSHLWERDELDFYVEPPAATESLLAVENFVGEVWDPACGQGNVLRALYRNGYSVRGSDVVDRGAPNFEREIDFLAPETPALAPNIVTNPPFFRAKGAESFARQALRLATGKVCLFVDIRFLAGGERANGLYAEHTPHRVWIVTPRVSCPPGSYLAAGGKAGNGSSDWCWLVWDLTAPPVTQATLGWLRRAA